MKICFSEIAGPTLSHRLWFGHLLTKGNSKHSLLHCPVVRKCENVPKLSKHNIGMSVNSFTLMCPSTCAKLEKIHLRLTHELVCKCWEFMRISSASCQIFLSITFAGNPAIVTGGYKILALQRCQAQQNAL